MVGGIVFVLAMVIAVPVGVMVAGGLWSVVIGWTAESSEGEGTISG